jgi:putative chitinase
MGTMNWQSILMKCGVRSTTAARWAPVFLAELGSADEPRLSAGAAELDDFLGQICHESGMLERVEENLNYSAERLMAVWPKRFPTVGSAVAFARNPEDLANKVYGGRLGNVDPGDGWRYRGRGLLQVTGRDNYAAVGKVLGLDLLADPGLLAQPEIALRASIAWWEGNVPDSVMGDIVRVTKRVNGGTIGLQHRQEVTAKAGAALDALGKA